MVPDVVVPVFAIIMATAWTIVSWVWVQTWLNYRAAQTADTRRFASVKLSKITILWFGETAASIAFGVATIFRPPRSLFVSTVIIYGLLVMSGSLAALAWRYYTEMRAFLAENDSSEEE